MKDIQKGQASIEFALVVPMLIFLFLSIVYVGITFMDYTQYSNAARDMARDISITSGSEEKKNLQTEINAKNDTVLSRYVSPLTNLYTPQYAVKFFNDKGAEEEEDPSKALDVLITIHLTRDDLPKPLEALGILPRELKPIIYKMRMEPKQENQENQENQGNQENQENQENG